jgi:RNA polymerase sigma-70 factor (ECF subfamily)
LLQHDPRALDRIAELLFVPVARREVRRFPTLDPVARRDAASDALGHYSREPQGYQPSKGAPLESYLTGMAVNRLRHWTREQAARARQEQKACARAAWTTQAGGGDASPGDGPSQNEASYEELWAVVERECPEPKQQAVVRLIVQGERRTEVFAEVLGLCHLPIEAQRGEVKRFKDQLKWRLRHAKVDGD